MVMSSNGHFSKVDLKVSQKSYHKIDIERFLPFLEKFHKQVFMLIQVFMRAHCACCIHIVPVVNGEHRTCCGGVKDLQDI